MSKPNKSESITISAVSEFTFKHNILSQVYSVCSLLVKVNFIPIQCWFSQYILRSKRKRSEGWNWPCSSGCPAQSWIPTRGMVPRHQLAVERAHDDISVCLWPGQLRLCVIKGKTINMELDSTGPTALKVTDSPLLRLLRATVWCKQRWPENRYYCTCGFRNRAADYLFSSVCEVH